jgi:hypothetical protein
MRAAIADQQLESLPDYEAHCLAAGRIALRCSVSEAWLASYGKELKDLLGPGDVQVEDLRSDERGIQCARTQGNAGLDACCRQSR